jgi:uncharacterized protein YndB with AHSA1/START domain
MATGSSPTDTAAVLEVRRTFNAARPRVFAAWTSAEALKRWHAPENAEVQEAGVDFRVGGKWYVKMRGYDGNMHHVAGVYREIDEPRRIVLTWRWLSQEDQESTVTVEFFERGAATEVVLTHEGLVSEQGRAAHNHGWVGCFDKLSAMFGSPVAR